MAGRPCQPTNPPPKRYKPPHLTTVTKERPHGNLQQRDIQTKISSPYCGAGTDNYAASYRQMSTNIGKPTMTPITGTTHATLQQNTVKYKPKRISNKITTTITTLKSVSLKPCSDKPLPAIHHHRDTTQTTIPTNLLPSDSANGRYTRKTDNATKSTGTHSAHIPFPSRFLTRNPHCSTSKKQTIDPVHPSVLQPSKHSPSYNLTLTLSNSTRLCQSLHSDNELNLDPTTNTSSKAAQNTYYAEAAHHNEPLITKLLCHQSPPKPQQPQPNVGNVLPMQDWTQRKVPIPCIKESVQPTLPFYNDLATETISPTPHSLIPRLPMQRLMQELALINTLLDHLSKMLSLATTSHPSSTPKNLFDLITELPQIDPKALILTDEPPQLLLLPAATCYNHPGGQSTRSLYWYRTPRLPCYNIARRTRYVSTEILQSHLQHTVPHTKDLLKVP